MTESSGICYYLGSKYGPTPLVVDLDDPAYGAFLNWMYFSDATLTFPQTLVLRYSQLEPEERRNPQVAGDYAKWFLGRLRAVEAATAIPNGSAPAASPRPTSSTATRCGSLETLDWPRISVPMSRPTGSDCRSAMRISGRWPRNGRPASSRMWRRESGHEVAP
jgi:hypothetical protein